MKKYRKENEMAYHKEYYEANKDKFKVVRDKYRKNPVNRNRINIQKRIKQRKVTLKKLYAKYDEYINLSVIAAKEQNADETLEIMNKMNELKQKIDIKANKIANLEKEKKLL